MRIIFTICILTFFAALSFGQELELISSWSNPDLVPSNAYNNTYNEVWGYTQDGREYAIIGSTEGTHIFDITDGGELEELFFIEGTSSGAHIIHRDYHDYEGYLYAVSDEDNQAEYGNLQIIDLTNLPESYEIVYEEHDLFRTTHNIFIDSIGAKLYAFAAKGGQTGYQALKVFDLTDPIAPVEIGNYKEFGNIDIGHVHDGFVSDDLAYLNCGYDGLFIVDFSEEEPELIARYNSSDYPDAGYNHSGWPNEELTHYYFADETHGMKMKVLETNDGFNSEIKGTFGVESSPLAIAHNQVIHKNFLFVSYYYDGLQVYDISDPESPINVAYYNTSKLQHAPTYEGAWGVYPFFPSGKIVVSDMQEGLFLFDCFDAYCDALVNSGSPEFKNTISVYPNPSSTSLTFESDIEIEEISMYNMMGQQVALFDQMNRSNTISVQDIPAGMYNLIFMKEDGQTENHKIVIQ